MKRNKKHEKRVRKMIIACCLCGIILSASTYAWFIGMKTVNVTPFEVNIAAIDGLALSLNGETWSDTVTINQDNYDEEGVVGADTTNSWSELIPMSSVGKIDTGSSRLVMYEKGSLTPSPGGYRLMASEVQNKGASEIRGYVAFDLFIQNLSGEEYYDEFNVLNEEAIYLTPESEVAVADAGANAAKTGIENSVRVAFAQIGRIEAGVDTATGENARAITCAGGGAANAVSICSRTAQIWEPNDTKHVANAINWYNESCASRKNEKSMFEADAYGDFGSCSEVEDGTAYNTYAVNKVIGYAEEVDVYDGADYNGYTQSSELTAFPYFTDTMKTKEGVQRPTFMTLAPKSVTKVRVYIYIEGQDVDNYDFASLGKKISVAFGFTKQRFYGEDINYEGPDLPSDVVRYEMVDYTKTGEINVSDKGVVWVEESSQFKVPRGITTFTFTDGGQLKTATATTDNDDTDNLLPEYLSWQIN